MNLIMSITSPSPSPLLFCGDFKVGSIEVPEISPNFCGAFLTSNAFRLFKINLANELKINRCKAVMKLNPHVFVCSGFALIPHGPSAASILSMNLNRQATALIYFS